MLSAKIFTLGEIIYLYGVVYGICKNHNKFSPQAYHTIDVCIKALGVMAIVAIIMQIGSGFLGFAKG